MRCIIASCLSSIVLLATSSQAQIPAFPGAEGFGAVSVGGRGGDVYHVTSLADTNTQGTLRHAVSSAPSSGRIVVFDISGNIKLNSDLSINRQKITIAGQTAPGQGVTLHGDSVWLESNDLVVRYLRSRLTSLGGTQDSLSIQNGNRIVMDHCSASWSADEVTSMTNNSSNNTIQWSFVTEALNSQNHSRASLFRPGTNVPSGTSPHEFNLSVHHSLYAHTSDRNPVFATYNGKTLNADFRNNVVFDWRNQASHTGNFESFVKEGLSDGITVIGDNPDATATLNLFGGRLTTKVLLKGAGGSFNFTGGELAAETVGFNLENNGGVISPDNSAGATHVLGDLTMTSGSILLEIAGNTEPLYDRLLVDGTLSAGGTLDIALLDYTPVAGDSFDLLDFGSLIGSFDVMLPSLGEGLVWDVSAFGSTGTLSVIADIADTADFDGDGDVDGRDFLVWQRGKSPNPGSAEDLALWQMQYGNPGGLSANVAVPEPVTGLLLAMLLGFVAAGRQLWSCG